MDGRAWRSWSGKKKKREKGGTTNSQALPGAGFFIRPIRVHPRVLPPNPYKEDKDERKDEEEKDREFSINRSNRWLNEEILKETAKFKLRIYDDRHKMT